MGDRANLGNQAPNQIHMRSAGAASVSRGMGTYRQRPGTKPVYAPYELQEGPFPDRDPDQVAKLYEESVGFKNMAGRPSVREAAKEAVMSGLKDVYNVMEFLRNKWLILYRLYRGETLAQFQYGRDQLHSPEPFKAVEAQHPRLMRALFGNQRWFKYVADGNTHDVNAEAQEMLVRDQLRASRYLDEADTLLRNGLIYGTAIQKTYWKQELQDMVYRDAKREPDESQPGGYKVKLEEVKRQEFVFDGNCVKEVELFDFYTSPNANSIEDAEWCADRSAWPDYRVKQMGELGHWKNLKELRDNPGSNDVSFGDEFKERKSYSYGVFDPREASWAPHIPHYTVIDWWGPLVIEQSNGEFVTKMCNVVMLEPDSLQLVVRVTENPFWHKKKPYQSWRPIKLKNEFYGIGTIEMIARLSMEKDTKRNLLMSATQLEANPMWLVADDANIPDGQLIAQPGLVIRVPNVENAMVPLVTPQVSDAALKAENILTKDIRETSGTTSPMLGASDPFGRGKTATQHTSEVDEAATRLAGPIMNWERGMGEPMLEQMAWNNQQFMSYPRVIRQIGPHGIRYQDQYTVRPEDVIGRFIVQTLASTRWTMKQTQVQQLVNILDRAPIINQMYGPQAVKMPKLLAMILEQGFDLQGVEEFISVPPEEAGLLSAGEEAEMWYHGSVPPRRADDNDMRHILAHLEEMKTERFNFLEQRSPQTAARVRAHIAEHIRKVELQQEIQEGMMMQMAQHATAMGIGGQNGSPAGAGSPTQDPDSPNVRSNEVERGEGQQAQSEAMQEAPNAGAV